MKPRTTVILVYDTDIEKADVLEKNIELLKQCVAVNSSNQSQMLDRNGFDIKKLWSKVPDNVLRSLGMTRKRLKNSDAIV